MKSQIWLPIVVAAGVFLGISTVVNNLLGWPNTIQVVYGGIVGLVLAACDHVIPRWVGWFSRLAVQCLVVLLLAALADLLMLWMGLVRPSIFAGLVPFLLVRRGLSTPSRPLP